jgi:hypothetical protein
MREVPLLDPCKPSLDWLCSAYIKEDDMPVDPNTLDTTLYENIKIPELGGLTLVELRKKIEELKSLTKTIRGIFSFTLKRYTSEERQARGLRASFREGELDAFHATLDGADLKPEFVADLADEDGGSDPSLLETPLLRARVAAYLLLYPAAEQLVEIASDLRDTATESGYLGKFLFNEIYGILKTMSARNDLLRSTMAKAINFFRSIAPKKSPPLK